MINSKQRAHLKALAHHEKPLVTVGKNGITPELTESVSEILKKYELVKINVLDSADLAPREVAAVLEGRTRSEIVQVIGKKVILYKKNHEKQVIFF